MDEGVVVAVMEARVDVVVEDGCLVAVWRCVGVCEG